MPTKPFTLVTKPGIKRDGTSLEGQFYNDGEWVRFQRGRPKKMGGYRTILSEFTGPIRGVHVFSKQMQNIIHSFSPSKVEAVLVDDNGLGASVYDRTPVGFVTNTDYLWQTDTFFDLAGSNKTVLVAHPGANLSSIDNIIQTPVYYGDVTASTPLIPLGQSVDGGVLSIQPYLVLYGSNGEVRNSAANEITNFSTGDANIANVASTKIVKGLPIRGSSQSPSALLWSLDSVIRMSFVGPPLVFRFDTMSAQSSILSSSCVIEYDGLFFWAGVDRFLMFSGSVQEVPNQMSINFFFDNLNYDQRQKVWATKIPRYGEICWFFPKGTTQTECNHVVIYNVREQTWYDTPLSRSAGYFSQVFRFPIFADSEPETSGKYSLWQHEFGYDRIKGDSVTAIRSFYTTHDMGFPTGTPSAESPNGEDRWTRIERVEPDFIQTGGISVEVLAREYANQDDTVVASGTFTEDTEKVDFRCQGRHWRLRFESNTLGGHYEMGSVIVHAGPGDSRQ